MLEASETLETLKVAMLSENESVKIALNNLLTVTALAEPTASEINKIRIADLNAEIAFLRDKIQKLEAELGDYLAAFGINSRGRSFNKDDMYRTNTDNGLWNTWYGSNSTGKA